jgi:hypothetical protein
MTASKSSWSEADHPRDPKGKRTGGWFVKAPTEKAWLQTPRGDIIQNLLHSDGGFTIQPVTGREPRTGYAVSIFPERSLSTTIEDMSPMVLAKYMMDNQDLLRQAGNHFGGWHDPKTHAIFLDVSQVVKTAAEAHDLALKHDQIAYFDFANMHSVDVNRNATSGGKV